MGFPHRMNLDVEALKKTFYDLSRKLHPDFFHGKSFKEKVLSVEQTTLLNKAYNTLKDPIARAEYLLDLEVPISEKERTKVDPVLVSEIFEIQEMVEEEKGSGNPALKTKLQQSKKEVEEKIKARRKVLEGHFKEWDVLEKDPAHKKDLARTIRKAIDEIAYLKNLIQSIETGGQIRH